MVMLPLAVGREPLEAVEVIGAITAEAGRNTTVPDSLGTVTVRSAVGSVKATVVSKSLAVAPSNTRPVLVRRVASFSTASVSVELSVSP